MNVLIYLWLGIGIGLWAASLLFMRPDDKKRGRDYLRTAMVIPGWPFYFAIVASAFGFAAYTKRQNDKVQES